MDNLVRTDTVFGKRVNIVGNISADLVLESLGKIYIKSRNKSLTLEEVIRSLTGEDPNISTSRVKVVEGIEGLDTTEFKEGTFVFDKLSNILYLFIDGELLELINVAPEGTGYVKRSGDTMTGRLAIYVKNGPPLYVNSSTLVENLNARYLNGETGESFTRRNRDEKINGAWTFRKPITFESSALFYKDIVTHGSIGTPEFSSGFGGYGWRMDADTNTLTIDNLVVRKLMQVYELVVNRISATNGSLWITNAGKVTSVLKLEIKESSFFADTAEYNKFCLNRHLGEFFIRLFDPIEYKSFTDPVAAFSTASGDGTFIKQCWSNETLRNAKIVKTLLDTSYAGSYFNDTNAENYRIYSLFSDEFVFDCTFPIITRNDYTRYLQEKEEGNVDIASYISVIYSYFKYFAGGDYYIVTFDDDGLPVFKPGDILRCLKWTYGGIKYYDAIVCNIIGKLFIILLADSILDKKTTITYDSSLNAQVTYGEDEINLGLYQQSSHYKEPSEDPNENINYDENGNVIRLSYLNQQKKDLIGLVEEKDSLVLMGNLWNPQRQNAVYITSTDNGAPFMDVISGVNRPDYSVIYYVPIYLTVKLHTTASVNKNTFVGFTHLVDIPYTGDYYILKDGTKCEYVYFKYNDVYYLASGSAVPSIPGGSVDIIYYLSTIPNENTEFGSASEFFFFLTEDGEKVITEGFEGGETVEEDYIVLEEEHPLLLVASTRTTKARLGNLNGIQDEIFPMDKLPYGYGLYGLNVFLTGEFYLSNGRSLADIGNDAITFAVAALNAFYNSLDVLKEDLQKADELLSLSVYSKGELRSAGMRIANNNILLWGNHIIIATTENEFKGIDLPTALFAEGKIQAKFISVQLLHSINNFYYNNNLPSQHTPNASSFTVDNEVFNGYGQVYFYCPIKHTENATNGEPVYITLVSTVYLREFRSANNRCWVWCDINGEWVGNSPTYITYKLFDNLSISSYSSFTPLLMALLDAYTPSIDPDAPLTADDIMYNMYLEFTDYISLNQLKLWSLHYDGKGNLGGNSLYWDTDGNVTVNGTLYSGSGQIGGFKLYLNYMEAKTAISRSFYMTSEQVTVGSNTITKYRVYNGLEQSDSQNIECTFPSGSTFESGNYTLKMGGSPIRLEPEMARITFYSYLNSRGTPYDCTIDPDTKTGTISYKGRGALSGDYLTFDDGTATPSTFVNLSKGGGSWVKDSVPMGALTILFNLIFIPILNKDYYSFYIRHSDAPVEGNVNRIFKSFKIYWNSSGHGIIAFTSMNTLDEWLWFREAFSSGRLSINITGTLKAKDTSLYSSYSFEYYNKGNTMPPFDLETYDDLQNPPSTLVPYRTWALKPSISNIFIPNDNRFDDLYKRCIKKNEFPYQCTVDGNDYSLKIDDAHNYVVTTYPLLAFNTSDDDSLNEGGIILQILYNNYDDLYLPYFSGVETQYDDQGAGDMETYTATVNRSTYQSYVTSFNNRLAAIASMENSANSEKSLAYATAKTAVEGFASSVLSNTDWDPVPSALLNAYTTTDNALTTAESKASLPDNPSE